MNTLPPSQPPDLSSRPPVEVSELLDRITDGIFAMDTEWRIVWANDRAAAILGVRKEDYVGRTFMECFPGMEDSIFMKAYRQAMATGQPAQFEAYFPPFERWYSISAYPSKTGISVLFRDVTQLRRDEEERHLLAQIVREAYNAVLVCGTDFRIRWVNEAFTRMSGYTFEEAVGKDACALLSHPDGDRAVIDEIFAHLNAGESFQVEKLHRTRQGAPVWWEVFYKPVHNREGQVTHFFAVAVDVTARRKSAEKQKRYEEKMREQHELVVEVLEQVRDGFLTISNEGRILYWNHQAEVLTGVPRHNALGHSLFDVFPHVKDSPFYKAYEQLLRNPEPIHTVIESPTNGRWVEIHAYRASKGLSVFFKDVTESKQNENALHRLSLVAEQTSNIVAITDNEQKVLWVNDAFTRITGFSFEESIGRHNGEIFDGPQTDAAVVEEVKRHFARREPFRIEVLNYKKDGSTYWADVTCQPVFDAQGDLLFFFSIATDITEQKRLQLHLEQERVRHQQQVTNAAIKAQEEERALVSQELHDNVNQVLTTVKLYTELCRDGIGNLKELTEKSIGLLQRSINEIRSLSKRLSAPSLGNIRLKDSVRELIEAVSATNKLSICFEDCQFNEQVPIDQDVHLALYRIIQEQLTNILKHAGATEAKVTLDDDGGQLRLVIADNGCGFDPGQRRAGIGITNMATRAESVQGNLDIQSAPGAGCRLVVKVPLS